MNERITVVDENNNIIGSAMASEAHHWGLWHRIVVIFVFNSQGQLFIQKRSPNADSSANLWDHSAAGHVDENEEPDVAARRELYEELGIDADYLTFLALYETQKTKGSQKLNRFWYLYMYLYNGPM